MIIRESRLQLLGALANSTVIFIDTKLATLERFRTLKCEMFATMVGLTTGEGTGLLIGLCDGQFTVTQVKEAIEANGPLGPNDTVTEDQADRPVWFAGAVDRETGTEAIFENEQGGHMMVLKPRWTFARTKSWNFFVYNLGDNLTTGSTVRLRAKSFGIWVT